MSTSYRAFRVNDGGGLVHMRDGQLTDSGQLVGAIMDTMIARLTDSPVDAQEHLDYAADTHKLFIEVSTDPSSTQYFIPHREVLVGDTAARAVQVAAMYGTPTVITGRNNVQVAFSPELEDKPDQSDEAQLIAANTTLVNDRAARDRTDSYERYIGEINALAAANGLDVYDPQDIRDWLEKIDNPGSPLPSPPAFATAFIADARTKGLIPAVP